MLESFCAAANLKAFMKRADCPQILQKCTSIIESCYQDDGRGVYKTSLRDFFEFEDSGTSPQAVIDWRKWADLESDIHAVLSTATRKLSSELQRWKMGSRVVLHSRYKIRGIQYSTNHCGEPNSLVFYEPDVGSEMVPGVVRAIFSVPAADYTEEKPHMHVILAVHRFMKKPTTMYDPFIEYPDFGASIWSNTLSEQAEVIPSTRKFCHAMRQTWDDDTSVMKPLTWVRSIATGHSQRYELIGKWSEMLTGALKERHAKGDSVRQT